MSFEDIKRFLGGIEFITCVLTFFANWFVLLSFIYARHRGVIRSFPLTPTTRLVLHLAFADILVGVGEAYVSVFSLWPDLDAQLVQFFVPCVLRFSGAYMTVTGSLCSLLAVALDRYAAIVHPLFYKNIATTRASWCVIVGCWVVPAAGSTIMFFMNTWESTLPTCDVNRVIPRFVLRFGLPTNLPILGGISFVHWRIHKEVRAFCNRGGHRAHCRRRSAQMLLLVTGICLVCWTPAVLMMAVMCATTPSPVMIILFEAAWMVAVASVLLNPMLYAWKTKSIRRAMVAPLAAAGLVPASWTAEAEASMAAAQGRDIVVRTAASAKRGNAAVAPATTCGSPPSLPTTQFTADSGTTEELESES